MENSELSNSQETKENPNSSTAWDMSKIPFMGEAEEQTEQKEAFEELLDDLNKADIVVYECLNASNDKTAKAEFLENPDLVHPNNEYGNLNPIQVETNLATIDNVKKEIDSQETVTWKKILAKTLIEDYSKKNKFLAANIAYNAAKTHEEKENAKAQHHETNVELYGEPDKDTFYCLLNEQLSKIHPTTEEESKLFEELKAKLGDIPSVTTERFRPKPETVARFSEIVKDFYGNFLNHIPADKESFSSSEVVDIINDILATEFDGGDVKYRAILDEKSNNASANHEERVIKFPPDKEYSRAKASALIVHELGTHVMRAVPYLDSSVEALSRELPNNETFDEGVAKCMEQALQGKYEDSGIDHYINIGLATFKDKNFREIYDIQMMIKSLQHKKSDTVLNAVQRCFRGTGELVNNKDLAYYNGANKVWQYIEEHIDDPELMDNLFLSGKSDIEDSNQSRLIYEMKIHP